MTHRSDLYMWIIYMISNSKWVRSSIQTSEREKKQNIIALQIRFYPSSSTVQSSTVFAAKFDSVRNYEDDEL